MATSETIYLSYADAALAHIELMRGWGESRYGVFDRSLVESALSRPQQAAAYDNADLPAQAATLLYGLIKNHPWVGGNKRTATALVQIFLRRNNFRIVAGPDELIDLVYAIEAGRWGLDEVGRWIDDHVRPKDA